MPWVPRAWHFFPFHGLMDACVASSPGMIPQAVLGKWLGSDEKKEEKYQIFRCLPLRFHLSQRFFLAKNNGPSFSSSISICASPWGYDIISERARLQLWECICLSCLTFKEPSGMISISRSVVWSIPVFFFSASVVSERPCLSERIRWPNRPAHRWRFSEFWCANLGNGGTAATSTHQSRHHGEGQGISWCGTFAFFLERERMEGERFYFWKFGLYKLDENGFVSNFVEVMRLYVFVLVARIESERWSRYVFKDRNQVSGNWECDLCKWCSLVSH